MKIYFKLLLFLCLPYLGVSQTYTDYFGIGQYTGLSVSSSDTVTALNSVNGTGRLPDLAEASRFLSQASMGYNYGEIEYVTQIGMDAWLDEQFNLPHASYYDAYETLYQTLRSMTGTDDRRGIYLTFVFYDMLFNEPDFLRQKVAFTLSQTLVIGLSALRGDGTASYYDMLYQGAFGNFRDILYNISVHHSMGIYLSALQNSKPDLGLGRQPDENYAREIMQLFSIGVYELNNDGTLKLDANGVPIETYDNEDIKELAKVFTGLGPTRRLDGSDAHYYYNSFQSEHHSPMRMYEGHHDTNEKTMLDGTVLSSGQTGLKDINDAIDVLFNHPNVGPFIGQQLIQQLVKSNPSPAYVSRVADVFNNNGQGVRGDMQAVVKAVLLDPEARNCDVLGDPKAGKLIQPMERLTNLCMAFDVSTPSGRFWLNDSDYFDRTEQSFLLSPSVFNFFRPDFAESLTVAPNDMVSPEFQILNTTSGIHYINIIERAIKVRAFDNRTRVQNSWLYHDNNDTPTLDFSDEINLFNTQGIAALLDRLDILLCRGQLSVDTRTTIQNTITQYQANVSGYNSDDAVKDVIYFIMISPDYVIRR